MSYFPWLVSHSRNQVLTQICQKKCSNHRLFLTDDWLKINCSIIDTSYFVYDIAWTSQTQLRAFSLHLVDFPFEVFKGLWQSTFEPCLKMFCKDIFKYTCIYMTIHLYFNSKWFSVWFLQYSAKLGTIFNSVWINCSL